MTAETPPFQAGLADGAARAAALDPARSFIVQAPAGSGKTSLLVNRFLRLLAAVAEPEEILAITFTRKAAEEMRGRIATALRDAEQGNTPRDEAAAITRHAAEQALARDREQGWHLARHPNRLRVQTIDSLCASLARQLPVLSRFGSPPAVTEAAGPLHAEAARATLDLLEDRDAERADRVAALVRHLDNNWGRAEELLADLLARREEWLGPLVGHRRDPGEARAVLEGALARAVSETLAAVRDAFPDDTLARALKAGDFAAARLAEAGKESPVRNLTGLALPPGDDPADLPVWQGLAALLLTGGGTWRKSVTKRDGFPTAKDAPAGEGGAYEAAKADLTALLDELRGDDALAQRLAAVARLPEPRYTEEQWQVLDALIEVLPLAAAQLEVVCRERGEIDFTGIGLAARDALGDPEAPTDLALVLDQRLSHLLVDEFQDTSNLQMAILRRLTAGWQPGDGRSLFLVGDPMQSIYRFRDAEVGLFLRARSHGIGDLAPEPLELTVNFRSDPAVVDAVNAAFPAILPAAEDVATGAVPFAAADAHHDPADGAAVDAHPVLYPKEAGESEANRAAEDTALAAEADIVTGLVREALAADPEGSVAVLVRARTHLDRILPALHAAGIGYQAVEIEPLAQRPVIQDLLALTRALLHPADRAAWLAVLRAPWTGLTLADLHHLADGRAPLAWRLADEEVLAGLSGDGRTRLEGVRNVLREAVRERRRGGLRRQLERVWRRLGGPATVQRTTDLEDAREYLALVESLEAGGELPDPEQLAERMERLYARPEGGGGHVQVMSIHKAKGLEFDTVILPGLGRQLAHGEGGRLLRHLERPTATGPDFLLAPVHPTGSESDPIYDYLGAIETERDRNELARLLYVATTRAKSRLHLVGHCPWKPDADELAPPGASLLGQLWPMAADAYEAARARGDTEPPSAARAASAAAGIRRLPAGWEPPAPPAGFRQGRRAPAEPAPESEPETPVPEPAEAAPAEDPAASATARHVGSLVHRMLRVMALQGPAAWDGRVAERRATFTGELAALGVAADQQDAAAERVVAALERTLSDDTGRWLLDPGHAEARCEYPVSGLADGQLVDGVIDRTFVDAEGTRWIVDYKTAAPAGDEPAAAFLDRQQALYRDQLARYAALLAGLEDRPLRLGLYFPVIAGWRAWQG
ncbi:MAG TPA: UvrD-helicase domain-containing protein [Gammaproteobacteria bacterium]|nr:UvrD-helicase domain-containing protein [Gammaproteobacteria bacterium]